MKALIVYHSVTGHTQKAGEDIARGLKEGNVEVVLKKVNEVSKSDIKDYDIIAIGSPTHGSRPSGKIRKLLGSLENGALSQKKVAAFSAYAGMGGDKTVARIEELLRDKGATKIVNGVHVRAGAPLSLWKGRDASAEDVEKCVEVGRKLAQG